MSRIGFIGILMIFLAAFMVAWAPVRQRIDVIDAIRDTWRAQTESYPSNPVGRIMSFEGTAEGQILADRSLAQFKLRGTASEESDARAKVERKRVALMAALNSAGYQNVDVREGAFTLDEDTTNDTSDLQKVAVLDLSVTFEEHVDLALLFGRADLSAIAQPMATRYWASNFNRELRALEDRALENAKLNAYRSLKRQDYRINKISYKNSLDRGETPHSAPSLPVLVTARIQIKQSQYPERRNPSRLATPKTVRAPTSNN